MYEWNKAIQKMICWIEENLTENPSLQEMSRQVGYSPYYCSVKFHEVVGMTIRNYIAGRRLAQATLEIRDTDERILDIAVKYGYSSQEALTRAHTGVRPPYTGSIRCRSHSASVRLYSCQNIMWTEEDQQ